MTISPAAGKPADPSILVNVPKLITDYYELRPDPSDPRQRVVFGTSGHRGSAFDVAFNEWHILAITQAICDYRKLQKIDGPLFLGIDTHALSEPAFASALEVLAANNVEVMLSEGTPYTPTPAVSHAILVYNRARNSGLADGIVITPSHNPPDDGGFKYDPPQGGPADSSVTSWVESKANDFLERGLDGVKRVLFSKALSAPTTHKHDYLSAYVSDLSNVVDMNAVRDAKLKLGVDPLGELDPRGAYQVLIDAAIILYFIPFLYMFAAVIKLADSKDRTENPHAVLVPGGKVGVWLCGSLGFLVVLLGIFVSLVPPGDSASKLGFELKLVIGTIVSILIGLALYWRGARTQQDG